MARMSVSTSTEKKRENRNPLHIKHGSEGKKKLKLFFCTAAEWGKFRKTIAVNGLLTQGCCQSSDTVVFFFLSCCMVTCLDRTHGTESQLFSKSSADEFFKKQITFTWIAPFTQEAIKRAAHKRKVEVKATLKHCLKNIELAKCRLNLTITTKGLHCRAGCSFVAFVARRSLIESQPEVFLGFPLWVQKHDC